jgi:hypothetical protein
VGSRSEGNIFTLQTRHLRETKASLHGGQNECVIPLAGPRLSIGRSQQRIYFLSAKEADHGTRKALARDRQDALDLGGVLRHFEGSVAKEGVDCRQTQVPCADTDAIVLFQVIKELSNERRSDLLELQFRGPRMQALLSKFQQEAEGISIGCDSVRANSTLLHKSL